ncbi:MAG TPA: acyltransferase family protein [Solirubrobacterales bacterium]|nr:acyltransferase family protein [Solirubrobacterales bacterium]
MPGIDALRAIAVLAVFFYHSSVGWMPGGFLGVDVFFVISGSLITDHAPVGWMSESNEKLAQAALGWPHNSLVSWNAAAKSRGGLTWDGIHLTPAGAREVARLIAATVRSQAQESSESAGR